MPNSSSAFAGACLLEARRSRWLSIWWAGLHLLLGATLALAALPAPLALLLVVPLSMHCARCRPVGSRLIVISPGARFALPADGRFDLALDPRSRLGSFWAELQFEDRPGAPILLWRDQFTVSEWRRLTIAMREGV